MSNAGNIHVLARAAIIDEGHILLCKTLDLPIAFYFLPGGHIEHGESAEEAALREILEETGARAKITRFIGLLEYSFEPGHNSICHNHEYNIIFEVESDDLKIHSIIPKMEDHIELIWMPLAEISNIDFRPEPLKKLLPNWLRHDASSGFMSEMI
ncbi:MAG: NUDIX domain-containing protein [Pseudomonadota bacterium]